MPPSSGRTSLVGFLAANFINVAITRAKEHFILVATDNKMPKGSNTEALIDYIRYHSKAIVHSHINSVFDLLYKNAAEERKRYLGDKKQISEFDSENLMYPLIMKLLEEHEEQDLDVVPHYPLRYIFNPKSSIFSTEESSYMRKDGTHVDFLIYKRIGKVPKLAIEVDGWHYHKERKQAERKRSNQRLNLLKAGFSPHSFCDERQWREGNPRECLEKHMKHEEH